MCLMPNYDDMGDQRLREFGTFPMEVGTKVTIDWPHVQQSSSGVIAGRIWISRLKQWCYWINYDDLGSLSMRSHEVFVSEMTNNLDKVYIHMYFQDKTLVPESRMMIRFDKGRPKFRFLPKGEKSEKAYLKAMQTPKGKGKKKRETKETWRSLAVRFIIIIRRTLLR